MKGTDELAFLIAWSIVKALKLIKSGSKSVFEAIFKGIPQPELFKSEIFQFIEELKVRVIAIKFAYAAKDSGVAIILIGQLLALFENIGGINKRYGKQIETVAKDYKQKFRGFMGYKGDPQLRVEGILRIAREIKSDMEDDRKKRAAVLKEKKERKKKGVIT